METNVRVTDLVCEYHTNPLGLDVLVPRLSWKLQEEHRGARQTAYQVLASSSEMELQGGNGDVWDSGKIVTDQSVHVAYGGRPLTSRQGVWWRVRVWDENDQPTEYSVPAFWEMGLLKRTEWVGDWIGSTVVGGTRTSAPCPYLRKSFTLGKAPVSARLYVTALGLYEAFINGQRVGKDIFTPGWTDYHKRVQYQVYDVTHLLGIGENVLGAILGDGWYCGYVGWLERQHYGDRPRLLGQLILDYDDGSSESIATDTSWKTASGPILESDLLMGESYDARLERSGWSETGFDDSEWSAVKTLDVPDTAVVGTSATTVRRMEELRPVIEPKPISAGGSTRWVYDFGQNMVGRVRLKIRGRAGMTITLRHAEVLKPDGSIYTDNLRAARQTDHYTMRGEGEEVYEPRFTFHGFRYVELSGFPDTPPDDALTAVVLHSDIPSTGSFECSDALINQLQRNIVWGLRGNFLEVPTDCPQRDERLGWTGDAQVFIRTAAFNRNVAPFFTKWVQSISDAQGDQGQIPAVVPALRGVKPDGGPAWADAAVICPWTIYLCYGDRTLLEKHYETLHRFIEYLRQASHELILMHPQHGEWQGHGDWLSINAETPKDLIGTAFFAYSTRLFAQIAEIVGRGEEAKKYTRLFEEIRASFNQRFATPDGLLVGQTQTAYVLALHFDLLPEHLRPVALNELVSNIERRGTHLSTGFVGTPYLMHVLTRFGRLDVAYKLLHQTTYPSWLYPVTQGATTIWERWDGWLHDKGFQDPAMNSFNHYAYGAIGDWLYSVVAGIDVDPEKPGYQQIVLRPRPGGHLTSARATLESLYGRIVSDWRLENGIFHWQVTVPPNTSVTVYVPASNPDDVRESDQPAHNAAGVTFLRMENGTAIYTVESGSYVWTAEPPI